MAKSHAGGWLLGLVLGLVSPLATAQAAPEIHRESANNANPANSADAASRGNPAPQNSSALVTEFREQARLGGTLFALQAQQSEVRIYAFRGGKAAKFGHNHVLSAPTFEGYFLLAPEGPASSRFALEFRLDQLAIDVPAQRSALGGSFARPLSADSIESTRDNLLGTTYLNAAQFPWVRITSLEIAGEDPKFVAHIALELRGQTRQFWVPLTVQGLPERLQVDGTFVVRQTDFGIQPLSILGGLLSVQDALVLEFSLRASRVSPP